MSPKDLSEPSVAARLRIMRELLADLEEIRVMPVESRVRQRALERVLTQLVDMAADINQHVVSAMTESAPRDYRSSFDGVAALGVISEALAADLKPSVGLRNVLVHQYVNADPQIIEASIPMAAAAYAEYVRLVARWLHER